MAVIYCIWQLHLKSAVVLRLHMFTCVLTHVCCHLLGTTLIVYSAYVCMEYRSLVSSKEARLQINMSLSVCKHHSTAGRAAKTVETPTNIRGFAG